MVVWFVGSILVGVFSDFKELDGWVVRIMLMCGELFFESKLVLVGSWGGLFVVVGEGKWVIIVCVNDVIGVVGFVLFGNYVDIMVNM